MAEVVQDVEQAAVFPLEAFAAIPVECYERCGKVSKNLGDIALQVLEDQTNGASNEWVRAFVCEKYSRRACNGVQLDAAVIEDGRTLASSISGPFFGKRNVAQDELMADATQANGAIKLVD